MLALGALVGEAAVGFVGKAAVGFVGPPAVLGTA